MIGDDGINDESSKTAPAPTVDVNLQEHRPSSKLSIAPLDHYAVDNYSERVASSLSNIIVLMCPNARRTDGTAECQCRWVS